MNYWNLHASSHCHGAAAIVVEIFDISCRGRYTSTTARSNYADDPDQNRLLLSLLSLAPAGLSRFCCPIQYRPWRSSKKQDARAHFQFNTHIYTRPRLFWSSLRREQRDSAFIQNSSTHGSIDGNSFQRPIAVAGARRLLPEHLPLTSACRADPGRL